MEGNKSEKQSLTTVTRIFFFLIFQSDGKIDGETVSHQNHTVTTGERYEVKKPRDSNVLRGDGSFIAETDKSAQYTWKKGERYEAVRPSTSELWKVSDYT